MEINKDQCSERAVILSICEKVTLMIVNKLTILHVITNSERVEANAE